MTFRGRFADSLVVEQLDKISLSFLADDLEVRRGGVAANIAFGMANLGQRPDPRRRRRGGLRRLPQLAGAPRRRLRVGARLGVAAHGAVRLHDRRRHGPDRHLLRRRDVRGPPDRARPDRRPRRRARPRRSIGANDPEAMLRHTQECRTRGIPFAADPSQQLAFADGDTHPPAHRRRRLPVHQRVRGGPHRAEDRLDPRRDRRPGHDPGHHAAARTAPSSHPRRGAHRGPGGPARSAGPTRPASATRSGPASSPAWPAAWTTGTRAELGSMLATYVLETVGTQEYTLGKARFLDRLAEAYGAESADEIAPHIACARSLTHDRRPCPGRRVEPPPTPVGLRPRRGRRPGRTSSGVGADLAPGTLLAAYRSGVFPMGLGEHGARPMGWWSPDPRGVLLPGRICGSAARCASRCRRFEMRVDTAFDEVVAALRRPLPRGPLDHPRDRRRLQPAARAGLGAQRRDLAGRRARRRALRRRDRRPVRGGVDVPRGTRRLQGRRWWPWPGCVFADGDPRRLIDVQWATDHLRTLGVVSSAARGLPPPPRASP